LLRTEEVDEQSKKQTQLSIRACAASSADDRVQQKLLELMACSMHTSLTLTLERGRRPEHARKAA
jgi:hypothetical protein